MEQITVNLLATGATPICHASQFDEGRVIRINLKKGAEVYTLSGTEEVKMRIRKPDNTERVIDIVNTSSSYVDYVSTPEDCDIEGVNVCELVVGEAGSKNFLMNVEEDAYGGGADIETLTASGPVATFETNMVDNLVDLKAEITPIQDLHGYNYPWPAGGGKNKIKTFDFSTTTAGVSYTSDDTGEIKMSASTATTNNSWMFNQNTGPEHTFLVKAGQYFLSGNTAGSSNKVFTYLLHRDWGSSGSFVSSSYDRGSGVLINFDVDKEVYLQVNAQPGFVGEFTLKPQLEGGSSATAWSPYSNICPITGHAEAKIVHTGKNLAIKENLNTTYFSMDNDGVFTQNNQSSAPFSWVYSNSIIKISLPAGTYTLTSFAKTISTNPNANVQVINDSDQRIANNVTMNSKTKSSVSFTLSKNSNIGIVAKIYEGAFYFQLELGSTATDYEPYAGTDVTVQFGQTVYKGVLDLKNSKVIATHVLGIFDGSNDESWNDYPAGNGFFVSGLSDHIKESYGDGLCNILPTSKSLSNLGVVYGINSFCIFIMQVKTAWNISTVSDLRTFLSSNPMQIMYKLAEPIEIPLSAISQFETLLGVNNVYSDTGDVELKYLKQV